MTLAEGLGVLAVLLSPLIALRVSEWIEQGRAEDERRRGVFRTLMATRATPTVPAHVEALNAIDIAFYEGRFTLRPKFKATRLAWKALLHHLTNSPGLQPAAGVGEQWLSQKNDLLARLLKEMASALHYDFDETYLKSAIYLPIAHGELFSDQEAIRRGLAAVLQGKAFLPVMIVPPPQPPAPPGPSPTVGPPSQGLLAEPPDVTRPS